MRVAPRYLVSTAVLLFVSFVLQGQGLDSILSLSTSDAFISVPHPTTPPQSDELTIALWLKSNSNRLSNKSEVILSKRKYPDLENFTNPENWEIFDATNASGQNDVRGFVGATFDGRYIYCSPWWKGNTQSGKVLRYDTREPYQDAAAWTVYDAENEDGHANIRGLEGNVFDGRYIYFVPLHNDGEYFAKVLRYDTHADFFDSDSWDVFDAGQIDGSGMMKGFVGAVFDGENIYFIPNPFAPHSRILKYDTTKSFQDPAAWSFYDLFPRLLTYDTNTGFFGGIFDGRYLYLVPYNQYGTVVRYDTSEDFLTDNAWSTVEFSYLFNGEVSGPFAGAAFDGRYIYFSPVSGGQVVRFDSTSDFFDPSSWNIASILNLDGTYNVHGGVGPTFDGRYVYFPPMHDTDGRSGKSIVYDTHQAFTDLASWRHIDLSLQDSYLRGFEGAVFDGEYVYFLPMNFEGAQGKIPRYKTYPTGDLTFQIEWHGSSSSFGSTPGKLSVSLGTEAGTRTAFFTGNQILDDNQWHHIAVTYDGSVVNLFVDGMLNAQSAFEDYAALTWNDADIIIGNSPGSRTNGYQGLLNDVAMWHKAFDETDIRNLVAQGPSGEDADLIAYWPFDTGLQSGAVEDYSANALHSISAHGVSFLPAVSALEHSTVCRLDSSFTFQTTYPDGGTWVGDAVTPSGTFSPNQAGPGTHAVTYEVTQIIGETPKTFSATTYVTVHDPLFDTPVIDQPTAYALKTDIVAPAYQWQKDGASLPDQTNILQIRGTGTYMVRMIDDNGCPTAPSEPLLISEWPAPSIRQIGLVTLEAVAEGHLFLWYRDGMLIDETNGRYSTSAPGNYQVQAIDVFGKVSSLSQPLTLDYPIVPVIERSDFRALTSNIYGASYEWYRNGILLEENSREINALLAGSYTVKVTDSLGVSTSFSEPFHYGDTWIAAAEGDQYDLVLSAGGPLTVCPIDTSYSMAGHYPAGGVWSGPGITRDGIFSSSRNMAGTNYTVSYTVSRTFKNTTRTFTATKQLSILEIPTISTSSATLSVGRETTLTANGDFSRYRWSTGDTTQSIVIGVSGEYTVEASNEFCTIKSQPFPIDNRAVVLYPNPAKKYFNIAFSEPHESVVVRITTPRGREVFRRKYEGRETRGIIAIDLTGLYAAFCLVSIETASGIEVHKLILSGAE